MRPLFVRPSSKRCHCRCCATIHSVAATYMESLLRHHQYFHRSDKEVDFSLGLVSKSLELLSTNSKNLLYRLSSCDLGKISNLALICLQNSFLVFDKRAMWLRIGMLNILILKKCPGAVTKMSDCRNGVEPVLLELIR